MLGNESHHLAFSADGARVVGERQENTYDRMSYHLPMSTPAPTTADRRGNEPAATRRALQPWLAAAIVALVLVQALIAGRSDRLFGSWDIGVHGAIGNVVFLLVLANAGLVALARAGRGALLTAAALTAVVVAQLGLGYAGRDSLAAAGWHIPMGVAAFGLGVWNLALAMLPTARASS